MRNVTARTLFGGEGCDLLIRRLRGQIPAQSSKSHKPLCSSGSVSWLTLAEMLWWSNDRIMTWHGSTLLSTTVDFFFFYFHDTWVLSALKCQYFTDWPPGGSRASPITLSLSCPNREEAPWQDNGKTWLITISTPSTKELWGRSKKNIQNSQSMKPLETFVVRI